MIKMILKLLKNFMGIKFYLNIVKFINTFAFYISFFLKSFKGFFILFGFDKYKSIILAN